MDSYIGKKFPNLSEAEFEAKVKQGPPADLIQQKSFYIRLDGNRTLFDLLREQPMIKKEWVPLIFSLIQCDLLLLTEKPQSIDKTSFLSSFVLDRSAIDNLHRSLKRVDTGFYSFSAFQLFVEQEFNRYQIYRHPFTVVTFDMWYLNQGKLEGLPTIAVSQCEHAIRSILRSIDLLCHFETLSYALILPNTESAAAAMLCHRLLETLSKQPLSHGLEANRLVLSFGMAGIPEDCRDVGIMLAAAKVARNVASQSDFPIVMFKDLKAPGDV